jgi:murein DD-endopeptidase MepM/ murein hydrolase activator NlpD
MNRREIVKYTVKLGDTLSTIADEYGVSLNTLLWTNKLTAKSSIKPGQTIEVLPISGTKHTVKSGENISLIASKYGVSAENIIEFNDLPADAFISIGDELIIPGGTPPVVTPPKKTYYASYVSADQEISAGYFIYPTSGRNWGVLHNVNAVDIANKCGTPIYAAAAGTVVLVDEVGWNSGYGKYAKILHPNGVETLYGHFSDIVASTDSKIEQGDLIGYMGTTGHSTGCHLHFEVRGAKNPFVR